MIKPLQVGIIGLGRSGWNLHAAGIAMHDKLQVAAVADPESDRREEAIAQFGCAAYTTPEAMLQDGKVELVIVATPSHTHGPLSIKALEAGKHVLVEKPMAMDTAEADEMLAAADRAGKSLTAYQIRRTAPDFLAVRDIVNSGVLGTIHLVKIASHSYTRRRDWQTIKRMGGGMLNNLGAHAIDLALTLMHGQWSDVLADVRHVTSAGDADDHAKVVFRGCGGAFADIEISTAAASPLAPPYWTILGRYGALTGTMQRLDWKYLDPASLEDRVLSDKTPPRAYEAAEELPWVEKSLEVGPNNAQPVFYDALYEHLRHGAPSPAPAHEIRNLTALFDACRAQNGL